MTEPADRPSPGHRFHRWLSLWVYLLIFLLPVLNGGKSFGALALLEIGAFLLAAILLAGKPVRFDRARILLLPLLLLGWALLGSAVNGTFYHAFPSLLIVLSYICLYLLVSESQLQPEDDPDAVLWFLTSAGLVVSIFGFFQLLTGRALYLIHHVPVVFSTFPNSNLFAGYLLIPLACAAALSWREFPRRGVRFMAACLSVLVILAGMFLSSSRGALLAAVVMGVWMAGRMAAGLTAAAKQRIWSAVAVLLLVTVVLLTIVPNPFMRRLANIRSGQDPFAFTRVSIWKGTLRLILDRPVFGCGWSGYQDAMDGYAFPSGETTARYGRVVNFAHNELLQVAAETGLPGFLLFGAFLVLLYQRLKQQGMSAPVLAMQGVLAGLLVHSLVDFNLHPPAIAASAVILLASLETNKGEWPAQAETIGRRKGRLVGALLAILLLALLTAAIGQAMGSWNASRGRYLRAASWQPWEYHWLDALGLQVWEKQPFGREGTFQASQMLFTTAEKLYSRDPYVHDHLARLYAWMDPRRYSREAVLHYEQGAAGRPFDPFIRSELAGFFFNQRQYQEALNWWEGAVQLEPNYVAALYGAGLTCERLGRSRDAAEWFRKARAVVALDLAPATDYEARLLDPGPLGKQKKSEK